jgi:hypothetical protein
MEKINQAVKHYYEDGGLQVLAIHGLAPQLCLLQSRAKSVQRKPRCGCDPHSRPLALRSLGRRARGRQRQISGLEYCGVALVGAETTRNENSYRRLRPASKPTVQQSKNKQAPFPRKNACLYALAFTIKVCNFFLPAC